jgi:exodeoxyribonuclease VII large subunit
MARLTARLEQTMRARLNRRVQAAHSCAARLHSLSPMAVLDRGYSVIETMPGGEVLRDARQAAVGQAVVARLAKGSLCCRVTEIVPDSPVNRDGIRCHETFFSERIDGGRREV